MEIGLIHEHTSLGRWIPNVSLLTEEFDFFCHVDDDLVYKYRHVGAHEERTHRYKKHKIKTVFTLSHFNRREKYGSTGAACQHIGGQSAPFGKFLCRSHWWLDTTLSQFSLH